LFPSPFLKIGFALVNPGNGLRSGFLAKIGQNSNEITGWGARRNGERRLEKIREETDSGGVLAGESQGEI